MKNFHTPHLRITTLLLFLFISLGLGAQPISPVNSGNMSQFLTEMDDYFGQIMSVTTTDIDQLLQPFVTGVQSTSCADPAPSVYNQDAQQITFRWPGTNGNSYKVAYLNLRTGDQGTYDINQISHSFSVEDGLYLFAFQQICGAKKSNTVIIILDKVVALTTAPDLPCDCTQTSIISGAEVEDFSLAPYDEMDVMIRAIGTLIPVFKMHIQRECPNCEEFLVTPYCHGNVPTDFQNNVAYLEIDETNDNVFTFTGEEMAITTNLPDGYEPAIAFCKGSPFPPTNGIISYQILNEIPGSTYRIRQTEQTKSAYQLTLFNQTGQVLFQHSLVGDALQSDISIDLSSYPSGLYYLRIEGRNTGETYKLIRF